MPKEVEQQIQEYLDDGYTLDEACEILSQLQHT